MSKSKPKYTTYHELSKAFASGEIGANYYLMLDKGGCSNSLNYYDENASDEENERQQDACRDLFHFDEDGDKAPIESACDALGIPCQWS